MKVITKATLDMNTMQWTAVESYDYAGPVALCKGDSTAKQAEQQQMQFQQQLMGIFAQQFGKQSQVFNFLQKTLQPQIKNPQGFQPQALAAMRAGATDSIAAGTKNTEQALNQYEVTHGGMQLPSGVNAQLEAGIAENAAAQNTAAQNDITTKDALLKQQNYWSSINALNGVGAEFNPQSFASEANQAGGETANLSQAVTASNQSQLLGALGGVAAGAGSALGGFMMKPKP